jgi:hypothetical protein
MRAAGGVEEDLRRARREKLARSATGMPRRRRSRPARQVEDLPRRPVEVTSSERSRAAQLDRIGIERRAISLQLVAERSTVIATIFGRRPSGAEARANLASDNPPRRATARAACRERD